MSKYGYRSPIYRKASTAEVIGSLVIHLVLSVSAAALGIKMYRDKGGDK